MGTLTNPRQTAAPRSRGASNVVVEPDAALSRILVDVLEAAGHNVVALATGTELSAYLAQPASAGTRSTEPDLVVLDLPHPNHTELDRLEWLGAVRGRFPFIAMTSFASEKEFLRVVEMGAYGVLDKPFEPAALRRLLHHIGLSTG